MVLTPLADAEKGWGWADLQSCVWTGPKWFGYLHCLQSVNEYRSLPVLFETVLRLSDATLDHFLGYLQEIKLKDQAAQGKR